MPDKHSIGGELPIKEFDSVIERAMDRENISLVALATRWGRTEQTVRRWKNNPHQSPTFNDMKAFIGLMTDSERMDLCVALFGKAPEMVDRINNADLAELESLAKSISDSCIRIVSITEAGTKPSSK